MTVFPNAYDLSVIHRNGRSPSGVRGTIGGYHQGQSNLRIAADFGTDLEVDTRMAQRKEAFTLSLMDISKAAHKFFLRELPNPIELDEDEFAVWHPDFKLDNVPDIKLAPLPQPERVHVPSAAEVLNRTSDISTSVKQALEHVVAKQSIPPSPVKRRRVDGERPVTDGPPPEPIQSAPLTLRERIRLKERLNKEEKMRREAAVPKGAKHAKTQWESCKILRSYSLNKRKNSLPVVDCITAVKRCMPTSISEVRIKETLVELTGVVPRWCQITKVQKKSYFAMVPGEFAGAREYFAPLIN